MAIFSMPFFNFYICLAILFLSLYRYTLMHVTRATIIKIYSLHALVNRGLKDIAMYRNI